MAMRMSADDKPPPHVFHAITTPLSEPLPVEKRPVLDVPDDSIPLTLPMIPQPIVQPAETTWLAPESGALLPNEDLAPAERVLDSGGDAIPIPATDLTYRATRSPDDYYPAASIRLQEQGVAVVEVCVNAQGRLDGRPVIQRTSGSRQLDAAAVRWASEALAFTPATRNGAAVAACKGFRVNFSLR
jgi:protein TonB